MREWEREREVEKRRGGEQLGYVLVVVLDCNFSSCANTSFLLCYLLFLSRVRMAKQR